MEQFVYVITDPAGMHARPAGLLVKVASGFSSEITIAKGDKSGDLKRIFSVMGLAARQGDTIVIHAEGADEKEAVKQVADCLRENL
ncbi:HPr family phosphocarrier protein [Intestinibacillus massiliensis]|uniref:HPr family phosphocarrier protein n=1 Tax=Intestinibacillus massiliensis TaxID=1871029 RepID=UPI000B34E6C1|nr:HPr family phosphocarrier protein [Intestinibacillus massiliensis]MCB6366157.1 HPr family phosphocarrier protein [Intestinibacillus massiliensis]